MPEFRAPAHVIGIAVALLGAAMLIPMLTDLWAGDPNWRGFAQGAFLAAFFGGTTAAASRGGNVGALGIRETFLVAIFVWLTLPIFGALPFMLGAPGARPVDAFFEAMSGLTTTGSTVFAGLDAMPAGTLLWRGMLQWFGGIGIIVVAMSFLPTLRVGGMQIFRSEAFDTFDKVLPRAAEIATVISSIYVGMTGACVLAYSAAGMSLFDAVVHAMTTIATGGFANYDASMGHFGPEVQYVGTVFMLLAALPFVRYVQLSAGALRPLLGDSQVHGVLYVFGGAVLLLTVWRLATDPAGDLAALEVHLRAVLFNTASILTGTGYASTDYQSWGPFAVAALFLLGLVGGAAGSTSCSIKIFRYQIMLSAILAQLKRIHSPHGVFKERFEGRPVSEEVISSVMGFIYLFLLTLAVLAIALSMMGYDAVTAVSAAASALANIGPGFGPIVGPAGNFAPLSDGAKWLLAFAMLLGRLELMAVFAALTPAFWRA